MQQAQNWDFNAIVLYDQPCDFFHTSSLEERHKLFCRLNKPLGVRDYVSNGTSSWMRSLLQIETLFTTKVDTNISLKLNWLTLVASSTSWTPDEYFGILLEAVLMYNRCVAAILGEDDSLDHEEVIWKEISDGKQCLYPILLFIINGKDPDKEKHEAKIKRLKLKRGAFRTMSLSANDYPLLLVSIDLGVCLHTSSLGLDLPMKVVDMFDRGLLVCTALAFLKLGKEWHCDSLKKGLKNVCQVGSVITYMYAKYGRLNLAYQIFRRTLDEVSVCWNSMIVSLSQNEKPEMAIDLFGQMGMSGTNFDFVSPTVIPIHKRETSLVERLALWCSELGLATTKEQVEEIEKTRKCLVVITLEVVEHHGEIVVYIHHVAVYQSVTIQGLFHSCT